MLYLFLHIFILLGFYFSRFKDKTANDWTDRDNFVKHGGKYDLLKMDYNGDDVSVSLFLLSICGCYFT